MASPSPTACFLCSFKKLGDFSEDCLRALARVPQLPNFLKRHRKQAVGASLFFGFFLLAKQKKETRKSRESDLLHYGAMLFSHCALM